MTSWPFLSTFTTLALTFIYAIDYSVVALGHYMRNSTKSKGASPAESPDKKEAKGRRAAMREGKVPEGAVDTEKAQV